MLKLSVCFSQASLHTPTFCKCDRSVPTPPETPQPVLVSTVSSVKLASTCPPVLAPSRLSRPTSTSCILAGAPSSTAASVSGALPCWRARLQGHLSHALGQCLARAGPLQTQAGSRLLVLAHRHSTHRAMSGDVPGAKGEHWEPAYAALLLAHSGRVLCLKKLVVKI